MTDWGTCGVCGRTGPKGTTCECGAYVSIFKCVAI